MFQLLGLWEKFTVKSCLGLSYYLQKVQLFPKSLLRGTRCSPKGHSSFKTGEAEDPDRALFFSSTSLSLCQFPFRLLPLLPTDSRPIALGILVCYLTICFPDVTAICATSQNCSQNFLIMWSKCSLVFLYFEYWRMYFFL